MAIPDFQHILVPFLETLKDGEERHLNEVTSALATVFHLSETELRQQYPSGNDNMFRNRIRFARSFLVRTGLLEYPRRGFVRISSSGKEVLRLKPEKIDSAFLKKVPGATPPLAVEKERDLDIENPSELLESGYQKIRRSLIQEVLDLVKKSSPHFFEKLVVELLLKMGYGGFASDAGRVIGQTGDGGIDGVIKEDKLGLDVIYIQAKRWEGTVGEPVIRDFVGSLVRNHANKGVIITASHFTKEAKEYIQHIPHRVILIDGETLASYMIDSDVGVSRVINYEVKKIDSDYFLED